MGKPQYSSNGPAISHSEEGPENFQESGNGFAPVFLGAGE